MKTIVAIITAVFLFTSCKQYCCYNEQIKGDSIVPVYRKTVFFHHARYYTADKRKTNIDLNAMGYMLEKRLFSKKNLSELSTNLHCLYPELSMYKIIPFEEKDKDNKCGLFIIIMTEKTSDSLFYELPFVYVNNSAMWLEYNPILFKEIETYLLMNGFTYSELKKREDRFSDGVVKKFNTHVNYYY